MATVICAHACRWKKETQLPVLCQTARPLQYGMKLNIHVYVYIYAFPAENLKKIPSTVMHIHIWYFLSSVAESQRFKLLTFTGHSSLEQSSILPSTAYAVLWHISCQFTSIHDFPAVAVWCPHPSVYTPICDAWFTYCFPSLVCGKFNSGISLWKTV